MPPFDTFRALPVVTLAGLIALTGCAGTDPHDEMALVRHSDITAGSAVDGKSTALTRIASAAYRARNYATAVTMFRRAHAENPEMIGPLIGLGKSYVQVGAQAQAAEAFRTAIKIDSESAEARRGLGNVLIALNKPRLAVDHLNESSKIVPDARTFNGLGVAHDMLGEHEQAQKFYRRGLKLQPGDRRLQGNIGLSLVLTGSYEQAIEYLLRIAQAPGATVRNRQNLALAYGLAGRMAESAQIARQDLDELSVSRNLAYYTTLRALDDPRATAEALGISPKQSDRNLLPKAASAVGP